MAPARSRSGGDHSGSSRARIPGRPAGARGRSAPRGRSGGSPARPAQTKLTTWLPRPLAQVPREQLEPRGRPSARTARASPGHRRPATSSFPPERGAPAAVGSSAPPPARPREAGPGKLCTAAAAADSLAAPARPLTFRQVLDALEGDLELERVVEGRRVVQHHDVVHLNLGHILETEEEGKKPHAQWEGAGGSAAARGKVRRAAARESERRPPPARPAPAGPTSCSGDLRNFSPAFLFTPERSTVRSGGIFFSSRSFPISPNYSPFCSDNSQRGPRLAAPEPRALLLPRGPRRQARWAPAPRTDSETFTAAPPAGVDQDKGGEQSERNTGWEAPRGDRRCRRRSRRRGGVHPGHAPGPAAPAPRIGRGRGGARRGRGGVVCGGVASAERAEGREGAAPSACFPALRLLLLVVVIVYLWGFSFSSAFTSTRRLLLILL